MGRRRPRRGRSGRLLRFAAVGAVVLIGLLYYKPLRTYVETRRALHGRAAEVERLRAERAALRHRLAVATSAEALTREARRLGLVEPGERLFIVKGIPGWRARASRLAGGGRG
jgi:cell division protein FtsB